LTTICFRYSIRLHATYALALNDPNVLRGIYNLQLVVQPSGLRDLHTFRFFPANLHVPIRAVGLAAHCVQLPWPVA
jgi:hypothetical protein